MKEQTEMFPLPTGEELRNKALAQVKENNGAWHVKAVMLSVYELEQRLGQRINGERLRHIVCRQIGNPPNGVEAGWGPVIMNIIREFPGLLIKSGLEKPKDRASNASQKPSYLINPKWRGR